jgi:hypothetical protein
MVKIKYQHREAQPLAQGHTAVSATPRSFEPGQGPPHGVPEGLTIYQSFYYSRPIHRFRFKCFIKSFNNSY